MRKSCKRKPLDPMASIRRRTGLDSTQKRDLGIAYHLALMSMETGHGTEQSWSTLCCVVNLAHLLCYHGVYAEILPDIIAAQYALIACKERAEAKGRWLFTGPELTLLNEVMLAHDYQMTLAPVGLIERLLNEMMEVLK